MKKLGEIGYIIVTFDIEDVGEIRYKLYRISEVVNSAFKFSGNKIQPKLYRVHKKLIRSDL
jgi:hypothetical protein